MAQRVQVLLTDDLDGTEANETLTFGLDGVTYEIDLSDDNASKLRDALAAFVGAARRRKGVTGPKSRRMTAAGPKIVDSGAIREWATKNGLEVKDRGRVPAPIREAYEKAHAA